MNDFTEIILKQAIECLARVELQTRNRDIREIVNELPEEEILGVLEHAAGRIKGKWEDYRKSINRKTRQKAL